MYYFLPRASITTSRPDRIAPTLLCPSRASSGGWIRSNEWILEMKEECGRAWSLFLWDNGRPRLELEPARAACLPCQSSADPFQLARLAVSSALVPQPARPPARPARLPASTTATATQEVGRSQKWRREASTGALVSLLSFVASDVAFVSLVPVAGGPPSSLARIRLSSEIGNKARPDLYDPTLPFQQAASRAAADANQPPTTILWAPTNDSCKRVRWSVRDVVLFVGR